jgi:hypothetical protein
MVTAEPLHHVHPLLRYDPDRPRQRHDDDHGDPCDEHPNEDVKWVHHGSFRLD